MEIEKERPPEDVAGMNPKELADKIVRTNFYYQERLYQELSKRYKEESEGDYNRPSLKDPTKKRTQLASSLEKMANAFEVEILPIIKKIINASKKYLFNPYEDSN